MKNFDGTNVTCNESGKVCYSGREAGEILNSTKHHHKSDHCGQAKKFPRRKYYCNCCGYYHLTSMKADYAENIENTNWDKYNEGIYLFRRNKIFA